MLVEGTGPCEIEGERVYSLNAFLWWEKNLKHSERFKKEFVNEPIKD